MSEYAEPTIALTLEHLDEEYIKNILNSLNIENLKIYTEYGEEIIYKIGNGKKILITSGYSLYDYKIVNSIILYTIYQLKTIRIEKALPRRVLQKFEIDIYPIVNKYAYNRYIVKNRIYRRSIMDEKGVQVIYDSLTLESKYSKILHRVISGLKPSIIILPVSNKTLNIDIKKPLINIISTSEETYKHVKDILRKIDLDIGDIFEKVDLLQLPHSHYVLEGLSSLGLMIVIPQEYSIRDVYRIIIKTIECIYEIPIELLEKILTGSIKREAEILCREECTQTLKEVLSTHGIEVEEVGPYRLKVRYYDDNILHRELISLKMLEYYADIEILL